MRRLLALLLLFTMATLIHAAKVNLTVPGQGPYKYWTDPKFPTAAPDGATIIEANPTALTLPDAGYLAIVNTETGNMVVKPVKDLKKDLVLAETDFNLISDVLVQVQHDGKPVAAANLSLKDGDRTQTAVLDQSLGGECHFFAVKQGTTDLKVQYVSKGKQAEPVDQNYPLDHVRTEKITLIRVSLPEDVATISAATKAGTDAPGGESQSTSDGTKGPQTVGTILGKTVTLIFGFLLVVGIGAGMIWLWKAHPTAVADKLTSLGVQIPKDPNEAMDTGPILPAAPVRPDPPQKIMLQDSDPTPLAAAPAPTPTSAPAASGPASRLVAEAGGSVDLPDGTTLIGREATLGLAVPDPSTLSRRHAELVRQGGHLLVRDLGSTNGTFVNGRKIDADTPLNAGDNVQFGAVRFKVEA